MRAGLHAKEILTDLTDSVKEAHVSARETPSTYFYGPDGELLVDFDTDPTHDVLGKWDWARVYYDAFMTVMLPTFDVITDWASLVSIAVTGLGGLFWNDCQLLDRVGSLWLGAIVTMLVATINGTILWGIGLYLLRLQWPRTGSFREKLRIAIKGFAEDQSTRFLCRREGETSRFRWAHIHQLATLFLEDILSLIATLFLLLTIGGTEITLLSFLVSVLSFSKHISSYFSLAVVCCCRACSLRTAVISRFCCCTFLCIGIVVAFVTVPFIVILTPSSVPQVLQVRSWSARIPALGIEQRFVPPADLRSLKGNGFLLFGGVDGKADLRLDPLLESYDIPDVSRFLPLYGGNFSTLPFDDALVIDLFSSLGGVLKEQPSANDVSPAQSGYYLLVKLWRRGCDAPRGLPTVAAGAIVAEQQRCMLDGFPENCTMSSVRIDPSIDFFPFNETSQIYDIMPAFSLELRWNNDLIRDRLACTMPCFRDSILCNGFGTRERNQLAYVDIDVQFGVSEALCVN